MPAARRIDIASGIAESAEMADAIGIAAALAPNEVIKVIHDTKLCHLVQTNGLRFNAECAAAEHMIRDPAGFLRHPVETIFGPQVFDQRKRFGLVFDAAEKKGRLLAPFSDFVAGLEGGRTIWDSSLMIADELYTNASKNAWSQDVGLFEGPASFEGRIEFFAAADKEMLLIGCRDTFGRLVPRDVIARIKTCFDQGVAESIRFGAGGAGIGSYMVFEACVSYYAGSDPGQASVVCVALPLGLSRRAMAAQPKNVHLVMIDRSAAAEPDAEEAS